VKRQKIDIKKIIKKRIELRHQHLVFIEKHQRIITKPIEVKLATKLTIVPVKSNANVKDAVKSITNKKCIVNQFAGLGDILFIEPIMRYYFQMGYRIILPIIKTYLNIQPHFPYIEMVDMSLFKINYENKQFIDTDEALIIPLRFSREFFKGSTYNDTMRNKYLMVNMDYNEWKSLTWLRHRYKEENLKKILNINNGDKYNLINENYSRALHRNIEINNGYKNIIMRFIDGYSLLDWSGVIESATTIHTVDTSLMYLLEILELSTDDVHVYSRYNRYGDFHKTEYLFNKKYIRHI
jgi:hypothetical protein